MVLAGRGSESESWWALNVACKVAAKKDTAAPRGAAVYKKLRILLLSVQQFDAKIYRVYFFPSSRIN